MKLFRITPPPPRDPSVCVTSGKSFMCSLLFTEPQGKRTVNIRVLEGRPDRSVIARRWQNDGEMPASVRRWHSLDTVGQRWRVGQQCPEIIQQNLRNCTAFPVQVSRVVLYD